MSVDHAIRESVVAAWFTFLAFWFVMAFGVKRTARRQSPHGRLFQVLMGGIACVLLFDGSREWGPLAARFVPAAQGSLVAGATITWTGVALVIWARTILGRNWSAIPAVKQGHTLIRNGPYSVVRHPIYSGLLVAGLGTAMAAGQLRGLLGVAIMFVGWLFKSKTEERFMIEEFGREYEEYRRRTWALVPFVF